MRRHTHTRVQYTFWIHMPTTRTSSNLAVVCTDTCIDPYCMCTNAWKLFFFGFCFVFLDTNLSTAPRSNRAQVCLPTDTVSSALPPSSLQRKGPKYFFNGSFYQLSPSAVCLWNCRANLHMGLCLGSPTEGCLADKA